MAYKPLSIEVDFKNQRFKDAAIGLAALADDIEADWDGMPKVLADELMKFLNSVVAAIIQRSSGAWPGGTSPAGVQPGTLSIRSGALNKSLVEGVKVEYGDSLESVKGSLSGNFYAVTQEYGATITVKNAQWLTIPLPAALDSRGVPLKPNAGAWKATGRTFIAKSKAGNLLIFYKVNSRQIVPLYALKKQVVIPPRLGLRDTVQAGLPYFVDKAVDAMLRNMKVAA